MQWIEVREKLPEPFEDLLLSDGTNIFFGWLEWQNNAEDPSWALSVCLKGEEDYEPIAYWRHLPEAPRSNS